ncbi:MAG: MFS transporter [Aestuariivirga sp.]|uniref:MFS transporter n=1 Tax=Aestuariivirga sp. TaxID=2650926 RepID=UPI0025C655FC|nr:MFS transporter [Aestuariivirga sp.]MCA3561230.1 MFS transporter [Aestuariivirga sp.]
MTDSSLVRARWAIAASFVVMGLVIGAWVPHVPLVKERLGVGPGVFGLALLSIAGGAVLAMPLTGVLVGRHGSCRMTVMTGLFFTLAFLLPTAAPTLATFVLGGMLMGMGIGSMDVSMNAHAIAIEKRRRRPVISMLHGIYSLGCLAGAVVGGMLIEWLGPGPQALITSAVCLCLLLGAARFLLPGSVDKGQSGTHFAWPTRATIGLGLLCYLALMIEGSVIDWAAILMREKFAVDAGIAALCFATYQGGMAVARLTGDWIRLKAGAVPMVFVSALLTALGTALGLIAHTPELAIAAFTLAGLGVGNIAPVMFAGGGRLEPTAPSRGIAAVTTLGYTGFLSGPPLIGFAAQVTGLNIALFLTVLAALIIAVFARAVKAADTY